jgi:hypothetical protein
VGSGASLDILEKAIICAPTEERKERDKGREDEEEDVSRY